LRGCRHCRNSRLKGVLSRNQRFDIDVSGPQQFDSARKAAASGADDGQFIDDDTPGFKRYGAVECRLENDCATRPSEIDAAARQVLASHGLADAFGHGTGHGLGLEVHEDPRISKLPGALPDEPVVPGMVFTIEPGAYLPGLGGVRIEDDVLVVESGCEVLTDVPIGF